MKFIKNISRALILISVCTFLTGCAAGAATAGYAIKSQTADSLTASAEQRIINRAKAEILAEIRRTEVTSQK